MNFDLSRRAARDQGHGEAVLRRPLQAREGPRAGRVPLLRRRPLEADRRARLARDRDLRGRRRPGPRPDRAGGAAGGVGLRLRPARRCWAAPARRWSISAAGSDEQRAEWLPKLASGEATGAFGGVVPDGESTLFCDLPTRRRRRRLRRRGRAAGAGRRARASSRSRRSTPPAPTPTVSEPAGERLPGRRRRRPRPPRGRDRRRADRRRPAGDGDGRRVRARAQAVRPPDRRLPGGLAPLRGDAAGRRGVALAHLLRRLGRRRRARVAADGGRDGRARAPRTPPGRSTASALQVFGGIGFTWEHDLQFWLKRSRVAGRMLGSPREHRDRVADLIGLGAGEPGAAGRGLGQRSSARR